MKIYLCAAYPRWRTLVDYRGQLEDLGHVVTSRWLNAGGALTDDGVRPEGTVQQRADFAVMDLHDLLGADCLITLTEPPGSPYTRGGRHVEFGVALAASKRLIVVGPRENVFHCLKGVEQYDTWDAALGRLCREWRDEHPGEQEPLVFRAAGNSTKGQ